MVKIAVAGGSGDVAREIIDVLSATKKHEILVLSRKDASSHEITTGAIWVQANYENIQELAETLRGVHTVLSFIDARLDVGNVSQRNLIDAAIQAGVKRFAPSEWASSSIEHLSWYNNKAEIRQYLKEVNKDKKVLEYSLFQPGLFINYLTYPNNSTKHLNPLQLPIDLENRRALVVDNGIGILTLTTVHDFSSVVAQAVEYDGEWPVVGGIKGTKLTVRELIEMCEKVRGGPFAIERLKEDDLKAGKVEASWLPKTSHRSFPEDQLEALTKMVVSGFLLSFKAGAWNVTDEWNQLLPDYEFTKAEEFLTEAWNGKP